MAKTPETKQFTVQMSTVHHVEATDEIEALKAAKDSLGGAAQILNVQIQNGHQHYS